MPLVLHPESLPRAELESLATEFTESLRETLDLVDHPRGRVLDPASLETARELVQSALAVLERPGDRSARALADAVNLGYATMVAAIDLVKSHTDVPRVPAPRPTSGSAAP